MEELISANYILSLDSQAVEDAALALVILDALVLAAVVCQLALFIDIHIIIIVTLPVIPHVEVDHALDPQLELLQLKAKI